MSGANPAEMFRQGEERLEEDIIGLQGTREPAGCQSTGLERAGMEARSRRLFQGGRTAGMIIVSMGKQDSFQVSRSISQSLDISQNSMCAAGDVGVYQGQSVTVDQQERVGR